MFRQIAIPLAALSLCATTPAFAQQEFRVSFDYPANASALEVYAGFQKTARQACEADLRRSGRTTLKHAMAYRAQCKAELLTKAVAAAGNPQLAALHRDALSDTQGQLLAQAE